MKMSSQIPRQWSRWAVLDSACRLAPLPSTPSKASSPHNTSAGSMPMDAAKCCCFGWIHGGGRRNRRGRRFERIFPRDCGLVSLIFAGSLHYVCLQNLSRALKELPAAGEGLVVSWAVGAVLLSRCYFFWCACQGRGRLYSLASHILLVGLSKLYAVEKDIYCRMGSVDTMLICAVSLLPSYWHFVSNTLPSSTNC